MIGAQCLGEYAKLVDMSADARVMKAVNELFQSPSIEVRQAASYMLGGVVIGNPAFFIDKLFKLFEDENNKEKQYYLNAIRMIIIANPQCLLGNVD